MNRALRIIFAGSSTFSTYQLKSLLNSSNKVVAILTQANMLLTNKKYMNPIISMAREFNLPIFQPHSLKTLETFKIIQSLHADIIVVASYGLIFPEKILKLPHFGCINIHCSMLPRWRGAAPIQRAIEAGDQSTGISIIQMNTKIDSGNILYKKNCNILPEENSQTLCIKLAKISAKSLPKIIKKIQQQTCKSYPQDNKLATYANKLSKKEGKINWNLSAIQIERNIRAFNPWPTSYFKLSSDGPIIKAWKAICLPNNKSNQYQPGFILYKGKFGLDISTGDGIIRITLLQIENKKTIQTFELLNAHPEWFKIGNILE